MLHADTSGYVSAAVYADRRFRNKVLRAALWDPTRIVAFPPRLDLTGIVRHCLSARRRELAFHVILLAIPVVWVIGVDAVLLGIGERFTVIETAYQFGLAISGLWVASAALSPLSSDPPTRPDLGGRGVLWLLCAFCVAVGIAAIGFWVVALLLIGPWALSVPITHWHRRWLHDEVIGPFLQGQPVSARPRVGGMAATRLLALEAQQRGNLAVYPESNRHLLVGCGAPLWLRGSFTIHVDVPHDDTMPVKEFDVNELVGAIRAAVGTIELEDVWAEDRVYVGDETLVRAPEWYDRTVGSAAGSVDHASLQRLMQRPEPFARHFLCIRVAERQWRDQLIFTLALHCCMNGSALTIESNKFVYKRLNLEFTRLGRRFSAINRGGTARALGRAAVDSPYLASRAPVALAEEVGVLFAERWASIKDAWRKWMAYHYVDRSVFDLRKIVSEESSVHNQLADILRYQSIVEERILRAIQEFFQEHNVDTSELDDSKTQVFNNIFNEGIIGPVNARNVAVGQGAGATSFEPTNAAPDGRPAA